VILLAVFPCLCGTILHAQPVITSDVCVYGGTSCGVAAAVEAARQGKTVVIVEIGGHLGGMTSGGQCRMDIGNKAAIGGIAREYFERLASHYGAGNHWVYEPGMAEKDFLEMVNAEKAPTFLHQRLHAVKKNGATIQQLQMESGQVFRALEYIDCSYEGDLMAMAGVSNAVGREPNSQYNETLNGIRATTPKCQFEVAVDPWIKPGDPSSGLLPLIQTNVFGFPGGGDESVQAFNFRMCLTQVESNRVTISPPEHYDPARYELLARYIEALAASGKTPKLADLIQFQAIPNGKSDVNNNGPISTDYVGGNGDYPNGTFEQRSDIWEAHEDYTRGLFHFLAVSQRVPEPLREEMQSWGLCKDEFVDNEGWPYQLFIREARRMVSDYVMTENNCAKSLAVPDAVGLAVGSPESHNCRRIVRNGRVENEGDVHGGSNPPFQISYRAIVPKAAQCENILVPVCLSASHIAYGAIRLEPVFMVLGHSAAAAACQAIDEKKPVQKIDVPKLQKRLITEHQVLEWKDENKTPLPK
jgi:hypothetical protein